MATSEELVRRDTRLQEIVEAGQKIYERIKDEMEAKYFGKFILVNIQTGEYVIGDSTRETHTVYGRRFGDVPAYGRQIGLEYPLSGF